jgi:hypothetical protein
MVPVLLGLGIAAAVAGLTALVIKFLGWDRIIGWFRNKQDLKEEDRDNIAFTVNQALANGNYSVVQGIFNTRTNELAGLNTDGGQKYEAEKIDDKLKEAHEGKDLLIYE